MTSAPKSASMAAADGTSTIEAASTTRIPWSSTGAFPPSAVPPDSSTMADVSVQRPSVCPIACPDTCSLTVTVKEDRIARIRGTHANPYTGDVLSAKVRHAYTTTVHDARLLRKQ